MHGGDDRGSTEAPGRSLIAEVGPSRKTSGRTLVNGHSCRYGPDMFARIVLVVFLLAGLGNVTAEVVVLKEKATVIGKVLAEKKDVVVVDLGYTVLSIPR